MTSMRYSGSVRALALGSPLVAGSCSLFDTDVKDPNAVEGGALGDPAAGSLLAAGLVYLTIAEMYDDFVISSDRTVPGDSLGTVAMVTLFDTASAYLGKALAIGTTLGSVDIRSQALGLRARARFSKAVWKTLKPA